MLSDIRTIGPNAGRSSTSLEHRVQSLMGRDQAHAPRSPDATIGAHATTLRFSPGTHAQALRWTTTAGSVKDVREPSVKNVRGLKCQGCPCLHNGSVVAQCAV
jgi:hypothetical protein